jgi:hypothetical protein
VKSKHVGYVLIVLITLGIIGLVARLVATEAQAQTLSGLRPLNAEVIDKVVMRDEKFETIVTKHEDGLWRVGSYPVLNLKLEEMWKTATLFDGAELIATNPANHEFMGVSPRNGTVVQFYRGDELQEEFIVGDKVFAPVGEEERIITPWTSEVLLCYLRRLDSDDVYGVYCQFPDRFQADSKWWKEPTVAGVPREEIDYLTYTSSTESFDLRVENSVWLVTDGTSSELASIQAVQALLRALERIISIDFPTDEEAEALDFSRPDATLRISTKPGSGSASVLLLFLKKGGGAYYVKDASRPYAYILDEIEAPKVLKNRQEIIPAPTPTPTPTSTP